MSELDHEYPYEAYFYKEGEPDSVVVRLHQSGEFYLDSEETSIYLNEHEFIHREDGPAVLLADDTDKFWYINGNELTEDEFNDYLAKKELRNSLQHDLKEKEQKPKEKI